MATHQPSTPSKENAFREILGVIIFLFSCVLTVFWRDFWAVTPIGIKLILFTIALFYAISGIWHKLKNNRKSGSWTILDWCFSWGIIGLLGATGININPSFSFANPLDNIPGLIVSLVFLIAICADIMQLSAPKREQPIA